MSTIKNQRCFTEATASARLILATGLSYTFCSDIPCCLLLQMSEGIETGLQAGYDKKIREGSPC